MDAARADNRRRFELELEFVQSLGNPHYLASLAQQDILSDPAFINYLDYLTYWADPEYARFVIYPHALHHLTLLQHENFREALKSGATEQWLHEKQFDHWRTWRSKAPPAISATLDVKTVSQQTTMVPLAAGPSSSSGATPLPGAAASTPRPSVSTPRRRATPISTPLPRASTPHAQPVSSTPLPLPPRSGSGGGGGGGGQSRRASGTGLPRRTSGVHVDTTKNGAS